MDRGNGTHAQGPVQADQDIVITKKIIVGDALAILRTLPSKSVQCCVTSPPYWGVRDYDVVGQIGAEEKIGEYISNLRKVFKEVKRILRTDGTMWLNIGDTYTSGNRGWRAPDRRNPSRGMHYRPDTPGNLKSKELVGVPWKLAFALQRQGWYLRSDIIWYKPNSQPESVKDRPTKAHEYLFLLTKSEQYFYDYEASREPSVSSGKGRNRRSVWSIKSQPNGGSHPAAFPSALVRPCILIGSRPGDLVIDPFFGTGTVGQVSVEEQRSFIGIDLNPEFCEQARQRPDLKDSEFQVGV